MKLNEFIDEELISEIPAGGLGQMAKKVGAKVLNKVPGGAAKSKAANLAGKADLGDTANNLHKEFNKYIGTQGKSMKQATGEDLSAFIKTKNHNTKATIPSGVLQKAQLDAVLMAVAKEALAGQGGTTAQQPAAKAPTQTDANKDGKDDKTGAPIKSAPAAKAQGAVKIPPKLQKQIDALTANEKTQLVGLLKQ